jgi:hypothetical protein
MHIFIKNNRVGLQYFFLLSKCCMELGFSPQIWGSGWELGFGCLTDRFGDGFLWKIGNWEVRRGF